MCESRGGGVGRGSVSPDPLKSIVFSISPDPLKSIVFSIIKILDPRILDVRMHSSIWICSARSE